MCGPSMAIDAVRTDAFLGGRLTLRQPESGYRAGLDAILLAAAVTDGARLMEAGCGVGAALLSVAHWQPGAQLLGVEREAAMAALARDNVIANGMADRVAIETADVLAPGAGGGFDGVFCNPPFDEPGRGNPPAPHRRHAHVTDQPLDVWVRRLADRLTGGGVLTMIHRADRLDGLLAATTGRVGGVQVRPLHPRDGALASRVLVRGVKGSRAPLAVLAGLVLHSADGAFTPMIDAVLRGEARFDWN